MYVEILVPLVCELMNCIQYCRFHDVMNVKESDLSGSVLQNVI